MRDLRRVIFYDFFVIFCDFLSQGNYICENNEFRISEQVIDEKKLSSYV